MFSSITMEEYMESELSGIFRVKLVTKNTVRGSPGTQFMHMRVKQGLYLFVVFVGIFRLLYFRMKRIKKTIKLLN